MPTTNETARTGFLREPVTEGAIRGGGRSVAASGDIPAPEIQWDSSGVGPLSLDKIDRGQNGFRDYWLEWLVAWDALLFQVE